MDKLFQFDYKIKKLGKHITYQMRSEFYNWAQENTTEDELDNDPKKVVRDFILSFSNEDKIKQMEKVDAGDF